jgi:outer membrane protein assembly factor BamB
MRPVVIVTVIGLLTGSCAAGDWPQFRGPNCSGIAVDAGSLPTEFSSEHNVRWSADLGDGIGSPVVAAGRVFTSAMVDEQTVGLYAFDAASGRKLWERTWQTGDLPEIHLTNSHASTTPAADDERVYFYFTTLGMIVVDAADGSDVWRQQLPEPFFVFKWGAGMSPVLHKDLLLFVQDDDLYPALYAFDKRTGDLRWKDDRNDMAVNYSHPVICSTERGDEIVVAGTGLLIGYDPADGKRLWQARTLLRNIKTTPVVRDGIIYISLQSGGIANQWLVSVDQAKTGNSDGRLTRDEVQAFVGEKKVPEAFFEKTFGRGDTDGDGDLEGEELDIAFLHPDNFAGASFTDRDPAQEFILAVRGGGRGDVTDTHVLWKHPTKYTDHIVSPLVIAERILLVKGGGIATGFSISDGESNYGPARIQNASDYFASPVYADGKIFIGAANGKVVVLDDALQFDVLAVNDMGSPVLGTPAVVGDTLFVRTRAGLVAIGE